MEDENVRREGGVERTEGYQKRAILKTFPKIGCIEKKNVDLHKHFNLNNNLVFF